MVKAQRHSESDLSHTGSSADWFFDVEKSGGYLIEMSVHNLDLCNWAIGATPIRAAGFGGILLYKDDPPGRSIMDGYTLSYDYPSGVKLYFTQMVFHPKGLPGGGQFVHVYGQKGACDLMGDTSVYPLDGSAPPSMLADKVDEHPSAHMRGFYDAIRGTGTNPADVIVGATTRADRDHGTHGHHRRQGRRVEGHRGRSREDGGVRREDGGRTKERGPRKGKGKTGSGRIEE